MAVQQFRALLSCLVIAFLMVIVTAQKNGLEENCLSPLGMEDGRINDYQIRATTILNDRNQAANSILNYQDVYGGWCPNQTRSGNITGPFYDQIIQVQLNMPVRLKGIVTQGRYNGVEKVGRYWIAYTPEKSLPSKWIFDEQTKSAKFFEGNINSKMRTNILKPPIVVEQMSIVPEMYKGKQVCLKFELLGCSLKYGIVTYKMPQGNTREGRYNFTDSSYDGFTKSHFLYDGLGMLTDGKLAPKDSFDTDGLGWIGWNAKDTPKPYIILEFLNTKIVRAMTLHCNVRDTAKIKLFSKVVISFSMDGVSFDESFQYKPKSVSSRSSFMNYNVTIDLHRHTRKLMKLQFSYTGLWILISEVTFHPERCSCYTFKNDSPMPWLQAFNYCARKSSNNHLVVMETEREWEFITKEIQTRKGGRENEWHIGLDRNLTTGKWTWINGKTVIIDKWQKGKPRDSDLFTLMAKEFPVGFKGSFSSINRCVSRGWICEEETDNCQGICLVHNPVQTASTLLATTTRPTTQSQQNISIAHDPTTTSGTVEKGPHEDDTMSDWSPFTTCSASCGGGLKTRYRTCNTSRFEGKDCSAHGQLTEQQPCNIQDCNGLTSREITIVSAFGSVFFIVVAALAVIFFAKHRAGRKPNVPDGSDEEEIQPYATVRLSRIFPLNDESNGPGNNDIPLETLPFELGTPQEERTTGKTELGNSPYENTNHLGESSVVPVEYLFYQPRYENEAVDGESRNVVIRPGYDKLTPATTNLPCEYDSLIRETDLSCKSRRRDITDTEGEGNMNIHTILEVPSSDERTPASNSLGKIKYECIENVWEKETRI